MPKDVESLSVLISDLKSDVTKLEDKMDQVNTNITKVTTVVEDLADVVVTLNRILTLGNGKPSLMTQVEVINNDLEEVKSNAQSALARVSIIERKLEPGTEKWKAVGKVAGLIAVAIPGSIDLALHFFGK